MTIVERDMLYARIRRNTGLSPWELNPAKLKGKAKEKRAKKEKKDETR